MAYIDDSGAVETYDPPIRVFMDVYGDNDLVARTLQRLLRKVRRGGTGSFCVSLIPKPNEASVRVELLKGDRVQVDIKDRDGEKSYIIERAETDDPDVKRRADVS